MKLGIPFLSDVAAVKSVASGSGLTGPALLAHSSPPYTPTWQVKAGLVFYSQAGRFATNGCLNGLSGSARELRVGLPGADLQTQHTHGAMQRAMTTPSQIAPHNPRLANASNPWNR